MTEAFLAARVRADRPDFTVEVDLDAAAGTTIGMIGPNGAGKSTVVRSLAGLLPLSDSSVRVGDALWHDGARVAVPTHRRRVGLVAQDPRLFPHLDVRANVAFGLRRRGHGRRDSRALATDWLERLGAGGLAARRPHELSGGQRQRVALARALATSPELLLLDEPFAALDVGSAQEIRSVVRERLAEFAGVAVLVTHDAIDALTLADHVVVLDSGRVTQEGTPWEIAAHPHTPHAARLVGLNVMSGQGVGTEVVLAGGRRVETAQPCSGPTQVTLAPSAITLATVAPLGSARNRWQGHVVALAPFGPVVRVELDVGFPLLADVLPESVTDLGLVRGTPVWASAKATEVRVLSSGDEAPLG